MSILISLPTELVCVILSQWLEWGDMMDLDSAFCNKEERPVLLETIFKSPYYQLNHALSQRNCIALTTWVYHRQRRVSELFLSMYTYVYCKIYASRFGKYVRRVRWHEILMPIEINKDLHASLVSQFCNLVSFTCHRCTINETIFEFLRCSMHLKDFALEGCFGETSSDFALFDWEHAPFESLLNVYIEINEFGNVPQLTDEILKHLMPAPQLQRLSVGCSDDSNGG